MEQIRQSWDLGMNRFFWDHVKRGLQIGSLFGTVVVLPVTVYKDMKKLKMFSFRRIMNKQAASLTLGLGLSMTWMMIRYFSWTNKEQKLHDETYYMPTGIQGDLDYVTTIWGGASFILTFLVTRSIVLSFGMMSPAITAGIIQSQMQKL